MRPCSGLLFVVTTVLMLFIRVIPVPSALSDESPEGLVGRWEFEDGTGKDLSGNGNDAVLQGTQIVSLGAGHSCAMLMPDTGPVRIPTSEDSPLAIPRGTLCFWLNVGWTHSNFLSFNNDAIELNVYRGDFQVRFRGENDFKYGSVILDYDWPQYDMREWAFYGHPRAAVHDSKWHHFAVAYDDQGKRIVGWRDGERIAVVDLSKVDTEPLKRKGLTAITTGKKFAGYLDDLRIYNRVLTDVDLREIHRVTKSIYAGRQDTNPTDKTYQSYKYKQENHALYSAWLQYGSRSERLDHDLLKRIVVEGSNATVRTAADELTEAVRSMFSCQPYYRDNVVLVPKGSAGDWDLSAPIPAIDGALIDNVTIKTSRDGLNLSQCSNVEVSNCHIDAVRYEDGYPAGGDDAIKLGSDLSLGNARPSQNIIVHSCYLASGCNGLQFGTETIAPFRNIRFENIRIRRAGKAGIGITSNDGSLITDIHFKNITMEKTFVPIFIKISDVARVPSGTYTRGAIRGLTFENITARDCYSYFKDREMPCVMWGKSGAPIENILLKNVQITVKGGHQASEADLDPAENDERFPRKVGDLPAYAWYLSHVKGIRFQDCHFGFERMDGRPSLVVDDGDKIAFERCSLQQGADTESPVVLRNGSEVTFNPGDSHAPPAP